MKRLLQEIRLYFHCLTHSHNSYKIENIFVNFILLFKRFRIPIWRTVKDRIIGCLTCEYNNSMEELQKNNRRFFQ